jgi:hypothetical protein
MEWFADAIRKMLEYCGTHGLEPPYIVCAASPDGSALVSRVIPGRAPETLAEHNSDGEWEVPIGGVLLDQTGQSLRFVFNPEGFGFEPLPKTVH